MGVTYDATRCSIGIGHWSRSRSARNGSVSFAAREELEREELDTTRGRRVSALRRGLRLKHQNPDLEGDARRGRIFAAGGRKGNTSVVIDATCT